MLIPDSEPPSVGSLREVSHLLRFPSSNLCEGHSFVARRGWLRTTSTNRPTDATGWFFSIIWYILLSFILKNDALIYLIYNIYSHLWESYVRTIQYVVKKINTRYQDIYFFTLICLVNLWHLNFNINDL